MMYFMLLLFNVILDISHAANVLIWSPTFGHSHVRFMGNIADILIKDGHNVTIVSPLMDPHVNMVGHNLPATQIPYKSKYHNLEDWLELDIKGAALWEAPKMEGRCISMDDMNVFMTINKKMFKGILEDTPFLNSLREQRFDVALHEVYEIAAVAIFEDCSGTFCPKHLYKLVNSLPIPNLSRDLEGRVKWRTIASLS
ncbi:hypothetical protein Y032_0449g1656 [Ancylostoma ceylanicum]|nr:hypothetical protein Y032_0449g1656 [Ancylostoma ceylanicum]